MTGGMAFVYDRAGAFESVLNPDSITWQRIETEYWDNLVCQLIAAHVEATQSAYAARILNNWDRERAKFWQVVPKDMLDKLEHPVRQTDLAAVGGDQPGAAE